MGTEPTPRMIDMRYPVKRYNHRSSAPPLSALTLAIALANLQAAAAPAPDAARGKSPAAADIEEVIVFGHPLARRAEDLAQPFAVLSGADLDERMAGTLGETVAQEPGVQNASFGVAVGRPVIRGQEGARVRTLEDNLDALDASTVSGDHAVSIEPFTANQIEILKGPATLLYGSGAIGGVVNVITGRIPESLPTEAIAGRAEVRGGDVADERTTSLRLDGALGQFAWHLDGLTRETSDYEVAGNPRSRRQLQRDAEEMAGEPELQPEAATDASAGRGVLRNSDLEADGYAAGLAWHGSGGFIGASYGNFATNYGLPGSDEGDVRIDLEQDRYDIVGAIDDPFAGIARLSARVGIVRYEHDEIEETGDIATHFENEGQDIRLLAEHEAIAGLEGAVGVQLVRREFSAIGEEAFVPSSDTDTTALFVTEGTALGDVRVQFGGRYERVEVDSDVARGLDFDAFSLSAGAIFALADGHSLSLQLDRSARAPVAEELLANGPHLATGAFEVGNADLDEEIANNLSLTYGYSSERLEVVGSLYYTAFDDFIYLVDTGDVEDGLPVRAHLQGDATFHGLEFESTVHLHQGEGTTFDVALFGDYVRGELDDADGGAGNSKDLPRIPPWRWGIALRGGWMDLAGELSLTRVARQDDVASFELPTDAYTMLDVSLTWHADLGPSHVELFARGNNLLDEEARNHLSVIKDVAPLPGRGVVGGLRVRF